MKELRRGGNARRWWSCAEGDTLGVGYDVIKKRNCNKTNYITSELNLGIFGIFLFLTCSRAKTKFTYTGASLAISSSMWKPWDLQI